ncbi:MAG: 1-acyl-sn-glycerol-3-phosphate acyltransferase [candidate division TM6 bacterium GW2011_GWF2_32_72]|nr:MAG: 1-acyl-sn-glycerol-3-phosphate acyltransferase [candidate division TM6 bacterium GW2011_GWF2_32_72]
MRCKIWWRIKRVFAYLGFLIVGIIFFIPAFIIACLPEKWRFDNRLFFNIFTKFFYHAVIKLVMVPVKFEGRKNITDDPSIIIANHQSSLDIPLVGKLLNGFPHIWLYTNRFSDLPLIGFVFRRMGIPVDMSSPRKAIEALHEAQRRFANESRHLIIFPEGGRYADNEIHKFFSGFARIAKETNRPVIPVVIWGVEKVLEPFGIWIKYSPVKVLVGEPFICGQEESPKEFTERVQAWYEKTFAQGLKSV